MKKIFLSLMLLAAVAFSSFETMENTGDNEIICDCDAPVAFKMSNGGVYQNTGSSIRFLTTSRQDCMAGFFVYHWRFNGSGVEIETYNNWMNTTVGSVNLPVGTSSVSHWLTLENDSGLIVCTTPSVTQNVTRIN